jgi:hypothetical protein
MSQLRQPSLADKFLQGAFVLVFMLSMLLDFYKVLDVLWRSLLIR